MNQELEILVKTLRECKAQAEQAMASSQSALEALNSIDFDYLTKHYGQKED